MKQFFAIAAAVIATAPVAAQPSTLADEYSVTIQYGDLDLASDKGMQRLDRRIAVGSRQACGYRDVPQMAQWEEVDSCRRGFVAQAKRKVDLALRSGTISQAASR